MDKTPVEGPVPVLQKDDSFFSKVGIDVTWDRQDVQKFHPHGGNPDGETVKFIVPKQPAGHFMFLGDMWLNMSVTLRDKDGKVLDGATDDVAPADNIGQTMFESVKMFLNETQVSSGNNSMYHYMCKVSNMLNHSSDKKRSQLRLQGYAEDNEADVNPVYHYEQPGYHIRKQFFGHYKDAVTFVYNAKGPSYFVVPLVSEFTPCRRPMTSGVECRLELVRSSPFFYLQGPEHAGQIPVEAGGAGTGGRTFADVGARVVIESLELCVPIKEMNASLTLEIEQHLSKKPITYQTMRMEVHKYPLSKGRQNFELNDLKTYVTSPERLFLFIVNDSRFSGKDGKNPYFFTPSVEYTGDDATKKNTGATLQTIRLCINNESQEAVDTSSYISTLFRKFKELNDALGYTRNSPDSVSFTPREYEVGKFVMGYDLTAGKNAALLGPDIRGRPREGAITLQMSFDKPLPEEAWLVVMADYHSGVTIDKNRSVLYKYLN